MINQIFSLVELLAALSNSQPATLELQTSILCSKFLSKYNLHYSVTNRMCNFQQSK